MISAESCATKISSSIPEKISQFTCLCCRVKFSSAQLQREHFRSEWHKYNLKRKVCQLEPISLIHFEQIQATAPVIKKEDDDSDLVSIRSKLNSELAEGNDDDDDWEEINEDELLDEDYDEEEAAELLAQVVKSDTCLFCTNISSDTKANIAHMDSHHGFFIPEEKYLSDLDGLMEYLGFKVGAGMTCLWCDKQFTTLHGARLHMLYKNHCKIYFDQDRATDEFSEFYDYSNQETFEMKRVQSLVVSKRAERRAEHSRALARIDTIRRDNQRQLIKKSDNLQLSKHTKGIKKFEAFRAKNLLRIGLANNYAVRGRLRQQNPI